MSKLTKGLTLGKKQFQSKELLTEAVSNYLGADYHILDFAYTEGIDQVAISVVHDREKHVFVVKQRKVRGILLGFLLFLALLGGSLYYWQQSQVPRANIIPAAIAPDLKDAQDIDKDELLRRMQKKVDEGYVNLQMNTEVIFNHGSDYGTIQVVNPEENKTIIAFEIFLVETDELLYSSGSVLPGQYINKGKLNRSLEKGSHQAYAAVKMYDENSKEEQNSSKVMMNLVVNS